MDTKDPNYQKRDSTQRAADRAAREARRERPALKGAAPAKPASAPPAHDWTVPVTERHPPEQHGHKAKK